MVPVVKSCKVDGLERGTEHMLNGLDMVKWSFHHLELVSCMDSTLVDTYSGTKS